MDRKILISKMEGISLAHGLVAKLHDQVEDEHRYTPSFLGLPRRKHHELMAQSRILMELGRLIQSQHDQLYREAIQTTREDK